MEEQVKMAKVEDLFQELAKVVAENFVATYEVNEGNVLVMKLPNGQKFQITVEEKVD